jgi:hypothetical protein
MLPEWVKRPDVISSTVMSVIGVIASLYSHEIRRSFGWPGKRLVQSQLAVSKNDLRHLQQMHDSAYELLLWLASCVCELILTAFWSWIVFAGGNVIYILLIGHSFWQSHTEPLYAVFGILTGSLFRIRGTIKALLNYDTAVAGMKATIEACQAQLAKESQAAQSGVR